MDTTTTGNGQPTPISGNTTEPQPQYSDNTSNDTTQGTPSTSPDTSTGNNATTTTSSTNITPPDQVRDNGMTFLKTNKAETAPLMNSLSWVGGRDSSAPEGTERYYYYSTDGTWSITVEYQTNSTLTYTITGTYGSPTMAVSFTETFTNGTFKLTSYSSQRISATPGQ